MKTAHSTSNIRVSRLLVDWMMVSLYLTVAIVMKKENRQNKSHSKNIRRVSSTLGPRKLHPIDRPDQRSLVQENIIDVVIQFLSSKGLVKTAESLRFQRSSVRTKGSRQQQRSRLLEYFSEGKRQQFFGEWKKLGQKLLQSDAGMKLEFECHVYFYIYRVNPAIRKDNYNNEVDRESSAALFNYFKLRGNELSKTYDSLTYYALPYMERPQDVPAVQHIFKKEWLVGLRQRLSKFVSESKGTQKRAETVLESWYNRQKSQPSESQSKELQRKNQQLITIIDEYNSLKKKFTEYIESSNQQCYDSQKKWYMFARELILTIKKQASFMETLRKGGQVQDSAIEILKERIQKYDRFLTKSIQDYMADQASISVFDRPSYLTDNSTFTIPPEPSRIELSRKPSENLIHLDFNKLFRQMHQLIEYDCPRDMARILKALRKRAVNQSLTGQRQSIYTYCMKDICFLKDENQKIRKFVITNQLTRNQYLRLMDIMTSKHYSKVNYLLAHPTLIPMLVNLLYQQPKQSSARKFALSSLQKLSLRKSAQEPLVREGIIEWTIKVLLNQVETISEYQIGFGTALLCNLIMNHKFIDKFVENRQPLITMTSFLLQKRLASHHYGYIVGVIYIATDQPLLKQELLKQNFKKTIQKINSLIAHEESEEFKVLQRQISHVEQRLNQPFTQPRARDDDLDEIDTEEEDDLRIVDDNQSDEQSQINTEVILKDYQLLGPDSVLQQEAVRNFFQESCKRIGGQSIRRVDSNSLEDNELQLGESMRRGRHQ